VNISDLMDLHELAKAEGRKYQLKRRLFDDLRRETGRHFTGIVGPRGVGKTILLRQWAAGHADAFYLSLDTLDRETDCFELLRTIHERMKFTTLLLDEVHFLKEPAAVLKRLYDFLDVRVVFTSSVALALRTAAHDLSRRVRLRSLHAFSYREYLRFTADLDLPVLELADLAARRWLPEHARAGHRFEPYLRGGMLPFALSEPEPLPLLANIVEKVITRDVPAVLRLSVDELDTLRRLLKFVGRSAVEGINYSSLAHNLGITKYKAEQYATCLDQAFILHQVFPAGTNVLREPKILLAPPCRLLYRDYDGALGGLREDFFAEALTQAAVPFHYLKSTRGAKTPDYLVEHDGERLVIEVGGRGKGRTQFKGIQTGQKIVLAHTDRPKDDAVPLFLAGFLV
jgi:predicted AAA+ superfamily ATPase